MNTIETIKIVRDFSDRPYGRYPDPDGDFCGENFRKQLLAPRLRTAEKVHVDLDGYNRYGRSFLDEAFGGLIREEGFTLDELKDKLSYSHKLVPTIEQLITERLEAAEQSK